MTDTIREKIIDELADLYTAFSFTSMTGTVGIYRGRSVFDADDDPPPLVTILPRVENNENSNYGMHEMTMPVDIICLAPLGSSNPSVLGEAVLGDLIKCAFGVQGVDKDGDIAKVGGMTTTYMDSMHYRSGGIDAYPDELGQEILRVGITVDIRYQTNAGNPYSNS